jgi:hypothetical protein
MGFFVDPPDYQRRNRDRDRVHSRDDSNRDTARQSVEDSCSDAELDLIHARERIERRQAHLDEARQEFKCLLNDEPKLAALWAKFEANGGANVEQLRQFLNGEMRPRIITKSGGLRLISDRPEANKIVHRRYDADDGGPNGA